MDRGGSSDVQWKTVPHSTDERLQQETLCRRQWTDDYVERPETLMRQNVRGRRLDSVSAGRRSSSQLPLTGVEQLRRSKSKPCPLHHAATASMRPVSVV